MSNSYSISTARRQIKRVFTYLKELTHIKTPPVVDVDKYEWLFWLDLLPLYPSIIRGSDFSSLQLLGLPPIPGQESNDGNFIIKVSRVRIASPAFHSFGFPNQNRRYCQH